MNEDDSMHTLFLRELKTTVSSLREFLQNFQKSSDPLSRLVDIGKLFRAIKGAASLLQLKQIESLSQTAENLLNQLIDTKIILGKEEISCLMDVVQFYQEIVEVKESLIFKELKKREGEIENLNIRLTALKLARSPLSALEKNEIVDLMKSQGVPKEEGNGEKSEIDTTMLDLFKSELETQTNLLNEGMIAFEQQSGQLSSLETLMRAAHSIKGAARAIRLNIIVQLAHVMEDYFVGLQNQKIILKDSETDVIFRAVDFLKRLSQIIPEEFENWLKSSTNELERLIDQITQFINGTPEKANDLSSIGSQTHFEPISQKYPHTIIKKAAAEERILRISAQNLNRLMGLAGESMVESRWLHPFSDSLLKVKKKLNELDSYLDYLAENLNETSLNQTAAQSLVNIQHKSHECRQDLSDRLSELEMFISRHSSLTDRLYTEVIECHMRPFSDGVEAFPRMVRDMAKQLNKKAKLEILGRSTPVDRDILQKLEAPLSHLLRNALDHGIELPEIRTSAGKPPEGTILLEARHRGGVLSITVSDDGQGIDTNKLRKIVVDKKLTKSEIAEKLTEQELFDFLFLPGFSTAGKVTELSGRGMGLNIVQTLVQEVAGSVWVNNVLGKGLSITLQLPVTLSVIRALIAVINDEPYAFPLARIDRALFVAQEDIALVENRQYFVFEGQNIGLVPASQVLEVGEKATSSTKPLPVIILSDRMNSYGLVVDSFQGERELVVQEIDERLGKIPNIIAGSFMEDGNPVLIVDVEDVVRSVDLLLSGGRLHSLSFSDNEIHVAAKKRILVVDDSITVREVECRLLRNYGFEVETAVNGADAWNAVRVGSYDLVVTDVDMPRMNGIELVKAIKNDYRLKSLPVMIVSYKEREIDKLLGLEAGANYYLTKSSFHDETLLNGVIDLIGKP